MVVATGGGSYGPGPWEAGPNGPAWPTARSEGARPHRAQHHPLRSPWCWATALHRPQHVATLGGHPPSGTRVAPTVTAPAVFDAW